MKKLTSVILCIILLLSCITVYASAEETSTTIEYLDDGSYIVTEIVESNSLARAAKSGSKTQTYYYSDNTAVFKVAVKGSFTFSSGVYAKATSSDVAVTVLEDSATFVNKTSSYSGATVYGYGCVKYKNVNRTLSPKITCDVYGNLS